MMVLNEMNQTREDCRAIRIHCNPSRLRRNKKTLERILDGLKAIISNQNAMNFAKEQLRSRYEDAVLPASYEHIVDNLSLTKIDFFEYFLNSTHTKSLTDHLRDALKQRSDHWVYNRPSPSLYAALIDDFLNEYQTYFMVIDPHLSTLRVAEISDTAPNGPSKLNSMRRATVELLLEHS